MQSAPEHSLYPRIGRFSLQQVLMVAFVGMASVAAVGCAPPGVTGDEPDAGGSGSGGAVGRGSGGATGSGGAVTSSGGAQGSGGQVGTGGAAASGGAVGSGGRVGTGGASASGGAVGSGGRVGTGGRQGTGGSGSGGRVGTGGASASGGSPGTGGAGSGGRIGMGGSTGTGGSTPTTTGCPSVGSSTTVNSTIVVKSGETYDGMCKRFLAGSSLGDGSQDEGQEPVFEIESGGTLINVVLGFPAADGVHTNGNATLRNITWEDIGEDALTIKGPGTVTLDGGSSAKGSDKTFQVNAASTFRISNFKATTAGKFIRQNGGTTFKMAVFIDRCDISNMSEAIARTDSSSSTVSMTNTRYNKIGDSLFIGFAASNITQSANTQY